jgi:putative transposase
LFNLVDDYNRETITIEVDTSLRSAWLVRLFERIKTERPPPDILPIDNGPEFLGEVFSDCCAEHGIFIDYIEPRKTNQNAFIERFNRSVSNEVLDLFLFRNLEQVREQIYLSTNGIS